MTQTPEGDRLAVTPALTSRQLHIASLLSDGHDLTEIAELLHIAEVTVRYHIDTAAMRIPGDLPRRTRVVAWFRGASGAVLEGPPGASLRRAMRMTQRGAQKSL